MDSCTDISGKGNLILSHVASGKITPSEASSLMTAISNQARIIEADELERRVSELENRNESK
jgi:polyhydroxyalkanoate synthesis regulator phasin